MPRNSNKVNLGTKNEGNVVPNHELSESDGDIECEQDSEEEDSSEMEKSKKKKTSKKRPTSKPSNKLEPKKAKKELLNKVETDIDSIDFKCERQTSDGKCCNFKIATWNVAGIRAWLKKNGPKYVRKELPDILCLQEVKCSESKLPPEVRIDGYNTYWSLGIKEGYAGVGLYTKEMPINVKNGIGMPEFDSEGRVIIAEFEKFYLVCVYVPNAGAGLKNLKKRLEWDFEFRKCLKSYDKKKPVIIAGDMNVSHQPIDLANPKTNTKSAGFTQEERDGMTALLEEGFVDTFRYLYPEKTGAYTYWTYLGNARSRNTGWRLDYFVMSERFLKHLCDNVIRHQVYGSDHCPIVLYMHV